MDDAENEGGNDPTENQPGTDSEERVFTQADIDRIVAKERKTAERKAERKYASMLEEKQNQERSEAPSQEHDPTSEKLDTVVELLTRQAKAAEERAAKAERDAQLQSVMSGIELSEQDREDVEALLKASGDTARARTLARRLADTASPPNSDKGFNEPGNGVNSQIRELPANVYDLTKDDISRLQAEGRLREVVEKAHRVGSGAVFSAKSFAKKK